MKKLLVGLLCLLSMLSVVDAQTAQQTQQLITSTFQNAGQSPIANQALQNLLQTTYGYSTSAATVGSSNAPETADGVFNLNANSLLHWRGAISRIRAGTGRGRFVVAGDSTSMGQGSGTSGLNALNGAFANAWPQVLAPILNKSIPTISQGLFGNQNAVGVTYSGYDPRATLGANWLASPTYGSIGTYTFHYTTGAVNNFTFTPTASFDRFIVYYIQSNFLSEGTATFNIDGGASLGTMNGVGTPAFANTGVQSVTAGTHTINVVPSNNGDFYIVGFLAWTSTTPGVDIIQDAGSGATALSSSGAGYPWSNLNAIPALAPDLTAIDLTINDTTQLTAPALYAAQMQSIISAATQTGDCLLIAGPPGNVTNVLNGAVYTYINILKQLAVANNCPLLDIPTRWVSYANTNPVLPYYDTIHPMALGYQDIAQAVSRMVNNP